MQNQSLYNFPEALFLNTVIANVNCETHDKYFLSCWCPEASILHPYFYIAHYSINFQPLENSLYIIGGLRGCFQKFS